MPKFSKRSLDNLSGIHPELVAVMEEAIKTTPVDFTITKGVRTTAEQKALYSIGRRGVKGEKKVTDKDGIIKKSDHQKKNDGFGHAVDLYPFVGGKLLVREPEVPGLLTQIAAHIKSVASGMGVKITWGGDWKMYDTPHFEI